LAEIGRLNVCARMVGGQDRDPRGENQPVGEDHRYEHEPRASKPTETPWLARAPEQPCRQAKQEESDRHEQKACPVFTPSADGTCVGDRQGATLERERT
jgi:hypothetical protein